MGGRYPPRADVLVPQGLPAGMHLAGARRPRPEDRERFFGQGAATRVHVIEAGWLPRMQACRLYAYRLPAEVFRPHEVGGYWVTDEPVEAIERVVIDDLARQARRCPDRASDHAVHLAILAAGYELDGRVQRLPVAQHRTAPRPLRLVSLPGP